MHPQRAVVTSKLATGRITEAGSDARKSSQGIIQKSQQYIESTIRTPDAEEAMINSLPSEDRDFIIVDSKRVQIMDESGQKQHSAVAKTQSSHINIIEGEAGWRTALNLSREGSQGSTEIKRAHFEDDKLPNLRLKSQFQVNKPVRAATIKDSSSIKLERWGKYGKDEHLAKDSKSKKKVLVKQPNFDITQDHVLGVQTDSSLSRSKSPSHRTSKHQSPQGKAVGSTTHKKSPKKQPPQKGLLPQKKKKDREMKEEEFNFDHYEFFNSNNRYLIQDYKDSFKEAKTKTVNKQRMKKVSTQLIYGFVYDILSSGQFTQPKDIPVLFRENQIRFANLMLRDQKVQNIMTDFEERISGIIQKEVVRNKDLFTLYMNHPRNSISPHRELVELAPSREEAQKRTQSVTHYRVEKAEDLELYDKVPFSYYQDIESRRQVLDRERPIEKGIQQAKERYNHVKAQKEKKKRQEQFVGVNKSLNKAEGQGKTAAQLAKEQHEKKLSKKELEELEIQREIERTQRLFELKMKKKAKARMKMNPFHRRIEEKADKIEEMIETFESNNIDLRNAVADTEAEFVLLDSKIDPAIRHVVPGSRVEKILHKWNQDMYHGDEDIVQWKQEYWKTLDKFEEELEEQQKGFEMAYDILQRKFDTETTKLKHQFLLQEDILNTTLIETKLKLHRERERANMTISEMESVRLNQVLQAKAVEELIVKAEKGLVLRSMTEAKLMIKEFLKIVKSKNTEIESFEKQLTYKSKMVEALEQKIYDKDKFYAEEQRQKKFYQTQILKLVRDLELFSGDPEKQQRFEAIYENEDDINYQRQIVVLLESIDLQQMLIDHVNKHYGHVEGLQKIQDNLNLIGLAQGGETLESSSSSMSYDSSVQKSTKSKKTVVRGGLKRLRSGVSSHESYQGTPKKRQTGELKLGQLMSLSKPQSPNRSRANAKFREGGIGSQSFDKRSPKYPQAKVQQLDGSTPKGAGSPNDNSRKSNQRSAAGKSAFLKPKRVEDDNISHQSSQISLGIKSRKKKKKVRDSHAIHRKVAKKAAKKHVFELIKKAINGEPEAPKASLDTGKPNEENVYEARENMVEFIRDIDPDELEQFNFLEEKKKKKAEADLKEEGGKEAGKNLKRRNTITKNMKRFLKQNKVNVVQEEEQKKIEKRIKEEKELEKLRQEQKKPTPAPQTPPDRSEDSASSDSLPEVRIEEPKEPKDKKDKTPAKAVSKPSSKERKPAAPPSKPAVPKQAPAKAPARPTKARGILFVVEELNRMCNLKYKEHVDEAQDEMDEHRVDYKLNSTQIHELQELTQSSMDIQMSYDDYFDLFKPNMMDFFNQVQKQIVKQYEFAEMNRYIASKGKYNPDAMLSKAELKHKEEDIQDQIRSASFGDIIQPVFSKKAELLGFQLRTELLPVLYINNDNDIKLVHRALRTVIYLNRLIQDGKYEDFELIQMPEGQDQRYKQKANAQVQVDTEELRAFGLHGGKVIEFPTDKVTRLMKVMAIGIQTRMKPYHRSYYESFWEEKDLGDVLKEHLEKVYLTGAELRQKEEMKMEQVLEQLCKYVVNVIQTIPDPDLKANLIFDRVFRQESFEEMENRKNNCKDVALMAQPKITHTAIMTGVDLLKNLIRDPSIITNLKNRELLSKAVKEEVERTIHILDEVAAFMDIKGETAFRKMLKEPVFDEEEDAVNQLRKGFGSSDSPEDPTKFTSELSQLHQQQQQKPKFTGYPFLVQSVGSSEQSVSPRDRNKSKDLVKTNSNLRRHNLTAQGQVGSKEFESKQFILNQSIYQSRDLSSTVSIDPQMQSQMVSIENSLDYASPETMAKQELKKMVKTKVNRIMKSSSPEVKEVVQELSNFINRKPVDLLGTGYSQHFGKDPPDHSANLQALKAQIPHGIRTQVFSPKGQPSHRGKNSEEGRQLVRFQLNQRSDAGAILEQGFQQSESFDRRSTEDPEIKIQGETKMLYHPSTTDGRIKVRDQQSFDSTQAEAQPPKVVKRGSPVATEGKSSGNEQNLSINRDIDETGFGSMKDCSRGPPILESELTTFLPDNFLFHQQPDLILGHSPHHKNRTKLSHHDRNSIVGGSILSGKHKKDSRPSTKLERISVPSGILNKALKAGKNFKWRNDELRQHYENMKSSTQDGSYLPPARMIAKASPRKKSPRYQSEFSSVGAGPQITRSPKNLKTQNQQRMFKKKEKNNMDLKLDTMEHSFRQATIQTSFTTKHRDRLQNLNIGDSNRLHVEFGNKILAEAQAAHTLQQKSPRGDTTSGAFARFSSITAGQQAAAAKGGGLFSPKETVNPNHLNSLIQQQHTDSDLVTTSKPLKPSRGIETASSLVHNQLKHLAKNHHPRNTNLGRVKLTSFEKSLRRSQEEMMHMSFASQVKNSPPKARPSKVSPSRLKAMGRASLNIQGTQMKQQRLDTLMVAQTPDPGVGEKRPEENKPPATALPHLNRGKNEDIRSPQDLSRLEFQSSDSNQRYIINVPVKDKKSEFMVEGWKRS